MQSRITKKRHFPDKPQNNYGGDYECNQYDKQSDGKEFCHDEGQGWWRGFIEWAIKDKNGKLKCNGNRHNCYKNRLKFLASLSGKEKEKYCDKYE